ncbi:MAG TPA: methyltransferase domain-containing protein [Burkholderiales bacterium]
MLRQIVKDYSVVTTLTPSGVVPQGTSSAAKGVIAYILEDNAAEASILDIGFGTGGLGELIKSDARTRHWSVDGVDGFEANCANPILLKSGIYRNIWHGLAQEIPLETLAQYKIICLLDVIEHLPAEAAKLLLETLLRNMGQDSFLFISIPLWFYPQDMMQSGDLEAHLIGVPVTSMTALKPKIYCVSEPFIGTFVLTKGSLDFIDAFQPTTDPRFSMERGMELADLIEFRYDTNIIFRTGW